MCLLGPKRGQNEVLGLFLAHNALVFADSVYYDWELWYLVASGGQSAEKKLLALKWAQLGPKRGQNEVLGYFLFNTHSFLPILHTMIENNNI